jgi:hypothetical protein
VGQQQILFLILGICIIGIALSVVSIAVQSDASRDNRAVLTHDLHQIASVAQTYCRLPLERGGGDGSFIGVSEWPKVRESLGASYRKVHGEFFINKMQLPSSVQIVAVGVEAGRDQSLPVRVALTVWADSTALDILN